MDAVRRTFADEVDTLVSTVRDLLDSANARSRVVAVHVLAAGIEALEHRVLHEANASGMSWAEIGKVYGVSRQAVHRRFADETAVPAEFFDALLRDLDEAAEEVPALARAARRARRAAVSP